MDEHRLIVTLTVAGDVGYRFSGHCRACGWSVSGKSGRDEVEMCYRVAHKDLKAARSA